MNHTHACFGKMTKFLSLFLALAVICSQLPMSVMAEAPLSSVPTLDTTTSPTTTHFLYANGTPITIKEDTDHTTCAVYKIGDTEHKITIPNPDITVIYGGSLGTAVASTAITMESGTIKQIYGGGKTTAAKSSQIDNAPVNGSANIIIRGGSVQNTIYGAGLGSDVLGNVNIEVDKATVSGPIYGSGLGCAIRTLTYIGTKDDASTGKVSIKISDTTVSSIWAGAAGGSVYGAAEITLNNSTVTNIYGATASSKGTGGTLGSFTAVMDSSSAVAEGGIISPFEKGNIIGITAVTLNSATYKSVVKVPDGKSVSITGGKTAPPVEGVTCEAPVLDVSVLYANGTPIIIKQDPADNKTYVYNESGTTKLLADALPETATVYGGLRAASTLASIPSTSITMLSGKVATIYGGGKKSTTENAYLSIKGGSVSNVYGGSYQPAASASQAYTEHVEISVSGTANIGDICAAGHTCVTGSATTTISGGTVQNIYGGMKGNSGSAYITGLTSIIVSGGTIAGDIYGAGAQAASITNNRAITIGKDAIFTGNIYPCKIGKNSGTAAIAVPANFDISRITVDTDAQKMVTTVNGVPMMNPEKPDNPSDTIAEKKITTENSLIFANGVPIRIKLDNSNQKTYIYDITGSTKLLDTPVDNASVFGGSCGTTVENTEVIMESGFLYRLYGGGFGGRVTGTAKVTLEKDANVSYSVIGGGTVGLNSTGEEKVLAITENAEVTINGGFAGKYIGGGGYKAIVNNTKIIFNDGVTQGLTAGTRSSVYDTNYNQVTGNTEIIMNNGTVTSIYGGSEASPVGGNATITINGGTIINSIFPIGNTSTGSNVKGTATVNVYKGFDTSVIQNQDKSNVVVNTSGTKNTQSSALIPALPTVHDSSILSAQSSDSGKLVFRFLELRINGEKRADATATKTGDSIFITFPNGENMLVDTGIADTADTLVNNLKALGVTKIDYLWCTHYHSDHVYGVPAVLDNFDVKNIYISGFDVKGAASCTLVQNAIAKHAATLNVHYYSNKAGYPTERQVIVGEGDKKVTIDVINPVIDQTDPGTGEEALNNSSLVMKLTYGSNSALLTADIYEAQEAFLVKSGLLDKVDMIKVPHHAITSSSSIDFIRAVSPKVAVVTNMQYQYAPALSTIHKYQSAGIQTYTTGLYGAVKVSMDGKSAPVTQTEWQYEDTVAPTISVTGNTASYLQSDNAAITPTVGTSGIAKIEVQKDNGAFADITDSYSAGYTVTENGTYTFKITNGAGVTATSSISYDKIDKTAPTGIISIKGNDFKTFLNTITFGLLFKDKVDVSITGADNLSGVKSIEYQKVASQADYNEKGAWTPYSAFSISADEKFIVYAKITDNAGNIVIINSDGVIVYSDSAVIDDAKILEPQVSADAPNTTLPDDINKIKEAVLSDSDKEKLAGGSKISIGLKVEKADVPQSDKDAIAAVLGEKTMALYLDLSLIKNIDGTESKITQTNSPIRITINIPENLRASDRTFAIVRMHNGVAETLMDLDNDPNTITIETSLFSTYAIVYENTKPSSSPAPGSEPAGSTNDTNGTANTGDATPIIPIVLIAVISLGLCAGLYKKSRLKI